MRGLTVVGCLTGAAVIAIGFHKLGAPENSGQGPAGGLRTARAASVIDAGSISPIQAQFERAVEAETGYKLAAHEALEGPSLKGDLREHEVAQFAVSTCPADAPVKVYDIAAIHVNMVLNRWGDADPAAYMFALQDEIPAIRAQEAAEEADHFGISLGVGGDAIQPLTIRANVGDCLRVALRNDVEGPVSFHAHGADMVLAGTEVPALSSNPDSFALPRETVEYEWFVDPEAYGENTHYAHSHGARARYLVSHGLFGAVIVEGAGAEYFDNRSGAPLCEEQDGELACRNSWDAMISPGGDGADFREFTLFYHEIGNARFAAVDKDGLALPIIDPVVNSYKPNGRAINYRSESFFRRMGEIEDQVGFYQEFKADEAEAYSSYTFGDPATPVPQSYIGDPTKIRLVHGGSETLHVPHLHGGGIQWQRQQDVGKDSAKDYTRIDAGLKKIFESSMPSSGNDSQTIGPSETYEIEIGCGSGGCQQTAGDFLFHCHVASHYISGMWHLWRVYNTLQDEGGKTDQLAVVAELPDRAGAYAPAVTSDALIGSQVAFAGTTIAVTEDNLENVVEAQLPPRGVPAHEQDAAVMDWDKRGNLYLNAPETKYAWPNYTPADAGSRSPLLFAAVTGKLAFPFMQPNLGHRPPFAPYHGPAPYLEPLRHNNGEPAPPGTNGDDSLCPANAPRRFYNIHAIQTEIPINSAQTEVDGMIFVLKENEDRARSDPDFKVPLAIRANQGDCIDVLLVNELEGLAKDRGLRPDLMKTNIHIHFVQFDTQASDGVITGFSYEQAPRPYTFEGMSTTIMSPRAPGAGEISVADASSFHVGSTIAVGIDQATETMETAVIDGIFGNQIVFKEPLRNAHSAGEHVSVEFVRYRWYAARQNGAIYFHDHVDALNRWGRGLFGALIAEPAGATYHDPATGEEIRSGPIADIRTDREVLPGLVGSFREFVLFMNDRNPQTGSTFNLRAEPLAAETKRGQGPKHLAMSSVLHGDPATPVLRAYAGDPMMFRLLTSATEEIHPFHITGHHFRQERFQADSPALTTFGVGISERFNAYVAAAGGASEMPGDYLYFNGAERHFLEGSWGILRVHDTLQDDLQPLPGRTPPAGPGFPKLAHSAVVPPRADAVGDVCPTDALEFGFAVSAIDVPLMFNAAAGLEQPTGRIYVLDDDVKAVTSGARRPEPLVIRANAGDCVTVRFTNRSSQPASFYVDGAATDPQASLGVTVGYNPDQAVRPGEWIDHRYYADEELGALLIRDFGNPYRNTREGMYGALIIEPAGAEYFDPFSNKPLRAGVQAVVRTNGGDSFREFVTIFQDTDPDIGLFLMPYDQEVDRLAGVNYRTEPLNNRLLQIGVIEDADAIPEDRLDLAQRVFDSDTFGDPDTNTFEAFAGDPVRFRVVSGHSEQSQVFSVEGHDWQLTPSIAGSDVVSSRYLPPTGVLNVELAGAGGPQARPGDYLWSNHRLPYLKAGQWGLLRVHEQGAETRLSKLYGDADTRFAGR